MINMRTLYTVVVEQSYCSSLLIRFIKTSQRESHRKRNLDPRAVPHFMQRVGPFYWTGKYLAGIPFTAILLNQLFHLHIKDAELVRGALFILFDGSKSHDGHVVPISSRLQFYLEHLLVEAKAKGLHADVQHLTLIASVDEYCGRAKQLREIMSVISLRNLIMTTITTFHFSTSGIPQPQN